MCENCPGKQVKASKNKIVTDPIKFYNNGDEAWLQLTYFPSYDEFQEIDGFIVLTEDVSSIINARREIVESEEKYRTMVELAPDSIFTIDLQGNITSCNSSFYKFSGYEESKILGKNFRDMNLILGEKIDKLEKIFRSIVAGQTPELIEVEWKTKDGRIIFSEVHASISYKDNKISGIQVISRDNTERKKAETLKSVIYNIALAVNITEELTELFDIIRLELSKVINTDNFYIALFDENSKELELSYYIDIHNHFEEFPSLKTLVHYLLEINSPLLLTEEKIKELKNKKIVEDSSSVPKSWLGIPLKIKQHTIGVMVVRDYEKENAFVQEDKMIFEYVSHQVAVSIQRKQDFEQLKIAKLAAEESDRLKTAFLHNISHEIRTPMNAIIGFSELLKNPSLLPEKRNQFTDTISKSSNQLLSIISDIINIATLESGQEKIVEKEIDLNSILGSLHEQFQLNVNTQNVRFTLNNPLDDNGFRIVTDDIKLVQVLTNLISNAIKFTMKGSINYGYQLKGNVLEFFVEDTGIGISPELHHIIFDRFRQVEGTEQQFGGSGLGLSISKGYVELMGGKMWLTSDLGKGTTFFFTIPYKKEEYKTSSSKPYSENGLQPIIKASKTILVAEDEDSNFMLIEEFLSELNANIIRVVNGIEAVNICKSEKDIDLILMDIKMPLMNGDEATKQIKAFMPNLPIIAQTAYSTVAEKEKILTYGCDDFISKPLKREVLISKIKEQLNKE